MNKVITEHQLHSLEDTIIAERKKIAEKNGDIFEGVSPEELNRELETRIGDKWLVKQEEKFHLKKNDINAIAGARYMRKGGLTLILITAVILLALSMVTRIIEMTQLYYYIYYIACGVVACGFLIKYANGITKARKTLWHQLGRDETQEDE